MNKRHSMDKPNNQFPVGKILTNFNKTSMRDSGERQMVLNTSMNGTLR